MRKLDRHEAIDQLKSTYAILADDIDAIVAIGKQEDTPFAQRTLVRTHFAFVEGLTHQLCQVAASSTSLKPDLFSVPEQALLRGETYDLDDAGRAVSRPSRAPLKRRIRLAFSAYPQIHGAHYTPNYGDAGWEALQEATKIRDRLMHPKSSSDLELTDQDLTHVINAADWFKEELLALLQACREADKRYTGGPAA